MEQAHRARVQKQAEVVEDVIPEGELPPPKDKAAGGKAGDQAEIPAGLKAKAEALVKAAVRGLNQINYSNN